ncbi:hypothetical protein PS467_20850 [Streptomyces luomodiensis]|uniref:Uncharacterized protein n=1 Tax=Streptomyces luomodiensis TaxID=3026192 RepID=A0ABY9UYK4_9ACTN|nr:hypothetical protein [Streptomyces sp. SCA4-21]WNE97603.1 hypothetical protein PS467_20850 [Streptomyces sp. SCA4-21]
MTTTTATVATATAVATTAEGTATTARQPGALTEAVTRDAAQRIRGDHP